MQLFFTDNKVVVVVTDENLSSCVFLSDDDTELA